MTDNLTTVGVMAALDLPPRLKMTETETEALVDRLMVLAERLHHKLRKEDGDGGP